MEKEERLKSTLRQVREFLVSPVWKDMKELMEGKLEVAINALISEKDIMIISRLQGGILEIKSLLGLPESMKEELQEEKKNAKD